MKITGTAMIRKQLQPLAKVAITVNLFCAFFTTWASEENVINDKSLKQDVRLQNADNKLAQIEHLEKQAAQKIDLLSSQLKSELVKAIKLGGFENGLEVCKTKAPEIAEKLSTDGWMIGRTSLKVRNIKNTPDEWETKTLIRFEEEVSEGVSADTLSFSAIQADKFRMMKGIPTAAVCVACHGSSIEQETANKIDELYPQDQATGYSLGDLRGAFTIEKFTHLH